MIHLELFIAWGIFRTGKKSMPDQESAKQITIMRNNPRRSNLLAKVIGVIGKEGIELATMIFVLKCKKKAAHLAA